MMEIKYGNKCVLTFTCTDADGDTITDLASASEIYFQIKETKDAEDKFVALTKTDDNIDVNTPSTGKIQVTILPADWCDRDEIDFEDGEFDAYFGLEIEYADDDIREITITELGTEKETVTILEDVVQN